MNQGDRDNETLAILAGRIGRLSVDVLGAMASDHKAGVALAKQAGITVATFPDEDMRGIFCALEAAAAKGRDKVAAAKLARALLRRMGWWNPDGPIARGPFWNDESLAGLFDSFPGVAALRKLASDLVACVAYWDGLSCIEDARRRLSLAERRIFQDIENLVQTPTITSRRGDEPGMERAA